MVIDLTESFEMQFTDIDDIPENLVGSHRRMLERFLEKNPL
jgi:hypothetical protein